MEERFSMVETRLDTIEKKLEKLDETNRMVNELYVKFVGNDLFPDSVLKEFTALKVEVAKLKQFKMKVLYTIGGAIMLGGFIGWIAQHIYNWLQFTGKH